MQHDTTILIPHFRTGRMTAYCIHQILKHKSNRDIKIIVIDNSNGEGVEYLQPFKDQIELVTYPVDKLMQSHGVAFDYAINLGLVETPYFITLESDSFPVQDGFLDIYADAYAQGFDLIGSLLTLSGGTFIHPTGAMYTMKLYEAAKLCVKHIPYVYIPNAAMKEDFPCHLMVREEMYGVFLNNPREYIVPNPAYKSFLSMRLNQERERYLPIATGVFHQGMGYNQESYYTYGKRNPMTALTDFTPTGEQLIYRIGCEPGQWLFNYAIAHGKRVGDIPTDIRWMENRVGQQQEYTLTANGVKHSWGTTAYHGVTDEGVQDIVKLKQDTMDALYNSMEAEYKI